MNSNEKIGCREVRRVLRYHTPNKHQYPEKYAHHLLLLFYPFRSEMSYLVEPHTHAKEIFLNMVYLSEIVHNNRRKFEPYAELVDEAYEHVMLS